MLGIGYFDREGRAAHGIGWAVPQSSGLVRRSTTSFPEVLRGLRLAYVAIFFSGCFSSRSRFGVRGASRLSLRHTGHNLDACLHSASLRSRFVCIFGTSCGVWSIGSRRWAQISRGLFCLEGLFCGSRERNKRRTREVVACSLCLVRLRSQSFRSSALRGAQDGRGDSQSFSFLCVRFPDLVFVSRVLLTGKKG